jgi:hypothetical protein
MDNPKVSNPNDFKVVQFSNSTDFNFTPEMGCMFDSRPISGTSGAAGIVAGETVMLPYHVAHRLAINLAKMVQVRKAPVVDPAGIPTGVPLWNEEGLQVIKNSFLKELYAEEKPIAMTETDRLMQKVEELKKFVDQKLGGEGSKAEAPVVADTVRQIATGDTTKAVFQDKAEVIAELGKRGIVHDKRKSKAELEKLLA